MTAELTDTIKMLADYYNYSDRMNDTQLQTYLSTLDDIPPEILELAAYDHIAQSQWFPKVSELREAAVRVQRNNARPIEYDEFKLEETSPLPYWRVISLFNASLRGDVAEVVLYANPQVTKILDLVSNEKESNPAP